MLISEALEGKYYRSRSLARRGKEGIIQWAEPKFVWGLGDKQFAYVVKVRSNFDLHSKIRQEDFYATVIVEANV